MPKVIRSMPEVVRSIRRPKTISSSFHFAKSKDKPFQEGIQIEEKFLGVFEESKIKLTEKVLSSIFMSMADNVIRMIAAEKMASRAWMKLK